MTTNTAFITQMVRCEASEIQGPIEFVDLSINSATDKEFMSS